MDVIRSWWEVPCVAHYCHIFQKPFKLPAFEIEELEDALLLDCFPSPSKLIVEIFCRFLDGIIDTEITEENWSLMLKLHLKWRCDNLKEKWNPLSGDAEYKDLDTYSRVTLLHKLCHWRLELDDIGELLRGMDGPSLRLDPVGKDMDGNTYWYFYGTRLYREETKKKKKKKEGSEEITAVKGGKGRSKEGSTPGGGKGRGKEAAGSTGRRRAVPSKGSQRGKNKQESATPSGRKSGRTSKRNHQVEEEEDEEEDGEEKEEVEEEGACSKESIGVHVEELVGKGDLDNQEGNHNSENSKCLNNEVANNLQQKAADTSWSVACTTVEEWNEVLESIKGSRHAETKRLYRVLEDFLPEVEYVFASREKQLKKRMLSELPRRTSDRIAIKAAIREEQERLDALEREMQREELRKLEAEEERAKEEEAEQKRQKRLEEALKRRKAREEQQQKQRLEEESNWEKAMSGELSGRRKAAIGAAENVSEVQRLAEDFLLTDKDFDLYTAMHKILAGIRKHDESWVFEEPVTEAIAPGYFEVIDKPMDYVTVEKKIEEQSYKSKEEFVADIELVYDNCVDYNGEDSEYFELAEEMRNIFHNLIGVHFEGKSPSEDKPEGKGKKGQHRESRSPSACKTPELTSESSSEEDSEDEGSDESYTEGERRRPKKAANKASMLKLTPSLEQRLGGVPPHRMPPPHHLPGPHFYPHLMHQHYRMPRPPHIPPGADMYPHGGPYPPRLPPPYPGMPPRSPQERGPHPPPMGMYPPPERTHPSMYPPGPHPHPGQDMMPRPPVYPAGPHPYPMPHPSHPAHPAHPHHAAYRQHMFYEMQYHGMDPRMMGMRPGGGMGARPGLSPRPRMDFGGQATRSPLSDVKLKETTSPSNQQKKHEESTKSETLLNGEAGMTGESQMREEKEKEKCEVKEGENSKEGGTDDNPKEGAKEEETAKPGSKNELSDDSTPDLQAHANTKESEESSVADKSNKPKSDDSKSSSTAPIAKKGEAPDKAQMTPEQLEKYRYHQHMMALQQQRREAMSRGYLFPPHGPPHFSHPTNPDEAAYYAHQYPGYPPHLPGHADPRQIEAAHHQQQQYWMEMERRRYHYAMLKARSQQQQQQQQHQQQGSKERSAETGQEGLEDVPDYQDSLRQYTLGLGEHETSNSNSSSPAHNEGAKKSVDPPNQGEMQLDTKRKRKAPDHASNLQRYPSNTPPHMMPNGYPYHMPPYHPGHSHHIPPDERRNGAGFPPDPYFSNPGPCRAPFYPPHPSMTRPDEKVTNPVKPVKDTAATPPPAKRPCPSDSV